MAAAKKPNEGDGVPQGRTVLGQLITAKFSDGTQRYFHKGDVLPDGVTAESLEHLSGLGFITDK